MASIISAGTTSATALNMSADTSGVLQLATNNGTVALTVNGSQQVGVGTQSPANLFHVSTSTASNSKFEQTGTGANYLTLRSNGSDRAFIGLENSSGTGLFGGGTAYGLSIGTTGSSAIAFATNNTVRGSIGPTGDVLFNTSATTGSNRNYPGVTTGVIQSGYQSWGSTTSGTTRSVTNFDIGCYIVTVIGSGVYHSRAVYILNAYDTADFGYSLLSASGYGASQTITCNASGFASINFGASFSNNLDSVQISWLRLA
jgi:hypothetical protein